jgi:hypothetical protein
MASRCALALLVFSCLTAGCGGDDPPPDFPEIGCGVEPEEDALVHFDRIEGECAILDPIPYESIDDPDVGCELLGVSQEDGACDANINCTGEVFEGQYYDIDFTLDYTVLPVVGDGELRVYEPETGVECFASYEVRIE